MLNAGKYNKKISIFQEVTEEDKSGFKNKYEENVELEIQAKEVTK